MFKINYYYCKKCGSTSLHTEVKGNNTGLFCNNCGFWVTWLEKNELRAFEHSQKESKREYKNTDSKNIITKFKDYVEYLDKLIDKEMDKMPSSKNDAIRKNSYCLALERSKSSILNILAGREYWNDIEG